MTGRPEGTPPDIRLSVTVAVLILAGMSGLFCLPVLIGGETFYAFDTLKQYLPWSAAAPPDFRPHNPLITDPVNIMYPYFLFFKESLGRYTLRYWNDAVLSGLPVLPVLHPALLLAYLLFSVSVAHDILLGTHLLLAGVFMLLFLRRIELRLPAALLGALAWMFNPYLMVWFEFENAILLAPCLAASLYFIELRLRDARPLHTVGLATAVAYGLAVNYAHLMIYQLLFCGLYAGIRYLHLKRQRIPLDLTFKRNRLSTVSAAVLVLSIGIAVALAHRSIAAAAQRSVLDFSELGLQTGRLPATYLITLLFPDFFGNPTGPLSFIPRIAGAQPYNNYNELCIYTGMVPLFMALVCLPGWRRRPHIPYFLAGAVVCILMAMGTVLYYPLARWVPGLGFSTPTRILYLFGFCMSALSALGADILLSKSGGRRYVLWGLWSLVLACMLAAVWAVQSDAVRQWITGLSPEIDWQRWRPLLAAHFRPASPVLLRPLLLAGAVWAVASMLAMDRVSGAVRPVLFWALVLILCLDLVRFGRHYNTTVSRSLAYPSTPAVEFLQKDRSRFRVVATDHFLPNGLAPFGIQDAGGYASFFPRRYARFFFISQQGADTPLPESFSRWTSFNRFGSPLLNLLNVKYFLVPPNWTTAAPGLKRVYEGEINIYENLQAFPRLFFVSGHELCPTPAAAFQKAASYSNADFKTKVILEAPPPPEFSPPAQPPRPESPRIEIRTYRTDRIEVDLDAERNGFLVIGDTYHPAWRARLDGAHTPVLRANTVMRAVAVPAGRHRVQLEFEPPAARSAVALAAAAWAILIGWLLAALVRQKRSS